MLFYKVWLAGLLAVPAWAQFQTDDEFHTACHNFRPTIADSNFELAEILPSGQSADLPYRDASCGGPGASPVVSQEICRVALYLKTSNRSGVQFEAWLPKDWTGRFLATGNGGIGGCIDYNGLAYTTQYGFVSVGSNNGHNGTAGRAFYNNPDVVEDFAGRSLHTITVVGKEVAKQFYKEPHSKSYFLGCSQGGRQGIGAAEKYPSDFDGIVAGSPALDFNNLISWRASFYPVTGPSTGPDFIKPTAWSGFIHDEVLKQCDELDGAKDGIIESPDKCNFRAEALLCQGSSTDNCLTETQVAQVKKFFSPLTFPDGSIVYPAMQPGSETRAIDRLYSGTPFSDSRDWFRYVIYSNPDWDPLKFTNLDAVKSRDANPFNIKTFPSNLDAFKATGGKIVMYHGMQDQQITSFITARWYDYLMQQTNQTSAQLDQFIRYFRISGMNHCASGPGAWNIGQMMQGDTPVQLDIFTNVLAVILEWVEGEYAPEFIEGKKTFDDSPTGQVAFTRRHCKYPKRNVYRGKMKEGDGMIGKTPSAKAGAPPIIITDVNDWHCE